MNADERFAVCFPITETYEGWHQFSNNPHDPGGATWCGVTQRAYDAWRRSCGQFLQDVRKATDSEIMAIARRQYWDAVRGDDLPAGVDLMLFDDAFNAGPVNAVELLQGGLGVVRDGQFGLETLGALQKCRDIEALIRNLYTGRLSYWRQLKIWVYFGRGWTNRDNGVEAKALKMAGVEP